MRQMYDLPAVLAQKIAGWIKTTPTGKYTTSDGNGLLNELAASEVRLPGQGLPLGSAPMITITLQLRSKLVGYIGTTPTGMHTLDDANALIEQLRAIAPRVQLQDGERLPAPEPARGKCVWATSVAAGTSWYHERHGRPPES